MTTGLTLMETPAVNQGKELGRATAESAARAEIESCIIVAKKFPRNEEECFQKLMKACQRPGFAADATYNFPRGDKEVTGPSVNLAREAARVWGNMRFGLHILRDDDETRLVRGWAWDVETNTKVEFDDDFKKLIQRKVKGKPGETVWLEPDERDLRELTNRRGAIVERNSILKVVPKDLIEKALYICSQTVANEAATDPDSARNRLIVDFGAINVTVSQLEEKLGHPLRQSTSEELTELRGVCNSIRDGNSTWAQYVKGADGKSAEKSAESKANEESLAKGQEALKQHQEQAKQPAEPSRPAGESPRPISCDEACFRLAQAQSPKELADVMNTTLACDYSADERKKVLDHKELAMKRLLGDGKKKK
jgi:hypothetical protein